MSEGVDAVHPMGGVRGCVSSVRSALAGLPEGDLPGDGAGVAGLLVEVVAAERQLAELRVRLSRVAEAQAEAAKVAAAGTDTWIAALTGTTRGQAAGGLWLARVLAENSLYEPVRLAFARGDLGAEAVRVILKAAEAVPAGVVAPADLQECVESLVARAVGGRLDPRRLRRVTRRTLDRLDPALADRHQAALLEASEQRADVWFTMHETTRGVWEGRFSIPALHADLLRTTLQHLTAPRRLSRNRAGAPVVDESAPTAPRWHSVQGAAFCELLEHLPTGGWTRSSPATVMIHLDYTHLDYTHLLDSLAAAHLDTGTDISARKARRLACGAGIIPAVFDGDPLPLDLGRRQRLFTPAQRAALSSVHDTCAAEGCQRPYAWTELHHLDWWSHGGPTDLANALPLCSWHHHRIHDPDYTHTRLPSGEVRYRRRRRGLGPPERVNDRAA
ncbi:hypothetical protein GCM10011519_12910 [Marmoricola endophyticus]|uniref:HNH nuclease domain-containing protein n=1 Tax=Marmoricola endophyticus TaxID=2040280 RepID=A0A917F438_9ACTN|nr:HNH endonuclease signature motif containing protein [Marmoricola endophyticus]GGF40637.1 hypothetical protein GCM10011519_12910 [Marmoricola endophyticus]